MSWFFKLQDYRLCDDFVLCLFDVCLMHYILAVASIHYDLIIYNIWCKQLWSPLTQEWTNASDMIECTVMVFDMIQNI